MTLNQIPLIPPDELGIFSQSLRSGEDGRMFMRSDPRLRSGIAARWQGIISAYPRVIVTDELIGKLVRELFEELQLTNKLPQDELIEEYWRSFFHSTALRVSSRISRTIGLPPTTVKGACLCSIGNLHDFYKSYKNTELDRKLLSDLKSYAYNKIRNSSYPDLRVQFSDDTIGRGNPGMITHYKSSIAHALRWVGQDESTNEILSESTIERKVSLCKSTIEYIKEENKKKKPGAKKLGINELKLSDFEKISRFYCDNTSKFEYLLEINESAKSKKEKLTIKDLDQLQRNELEKLRCQLYDDLPQSIEDELDNIGAIIRRFIRRNRSISIDTPIGVDNEGLNLGDIIASEDDSPEEAIENLETRERSQGMLPTCIIWLDSESAKLTLDEKQMLYLYHKLSVVYEQIAPIVDLKSYTNVSRPVRKLTAKMANFVTDTINKEDLTIYRINTLPTIKKIEEILKTEFDRFNISRVNSEARSDLEPLIKEYKQYLKELRQEYHRFKKTILVGIRGHEYRKQLERLEELSQEEYPDLNRRLTRASFQDLIEKINIPLSQLWEN